MARKTRKHSKHESVKTIPQLRRLFEHIEDFVDSHISKRRSKESLSRELRKEWKHVFVKELDKKAADTFIEHRMKQRRTLRATRKQQGGNPIAGAQLEYATRQGVYLAPNSIPSDGHLPLSRDQSGGAYGSYIDYVHAGFWNPEEAKTYDPIPGQQAFPVPYPSTGSNLVGGKRHRKIRGGNPLGAMITQATQRPFGSTAPPGILPDAQSAAYGQQLGSSPDQIQRQVVETHARYSPPL